MLTSYLLPHKYQRLGWVLLPLSVLLLFLSVYLEYEISWLEIEGIREAGFLEDSNENFTNELAILGTFISLFLIAFSKEKEEDEYIQKLRLESLLVAFYIYSGVLILSTLFFFGFLYLEFLGYNLFLLQILFIVRFRWVMYRQKKGIFAI
ncbi:hypothetical protein [Algoriphagus namhaensis]